MNFRQIVIKKMEELGWSAYKLAVEAERLGVSRATTYEFVAGKRAINTLSLEKMLDAMGVKVEIR